MACPKCGCKVTYHYDDSYDGDCDGDDFWERCAACGHVFDIDLAGDDDEE